MRPLVIVIPEKLVQCPAARLHRKQRLDVQALVVDGAVLRRGTQDTFVTML